MSTLTFAQLREANVGRQGPDGWNQSLESWSFTDWLTATAGEIGEACNVVKKLNRVRDGLPGNTRSSGELLLDLALELADAVLYLDLLCASQDVPAWGDTFDVLRGMSEAVIEDSALRNRSPSDFAAVTLVYLGRLAEATDNHQVAHQARMVLSCLDKVALAFGIDLGAAVAFKFNSTSLKLGFPHLLPSTRLEDVRPGAAR